MIRPCIALLLLAGCSSGGQARPITATPQPLAETPRCQVLFFPGLGDQPESYEGFIAILDRYGVDAETVSVPNRDYGTDDYSERLLHDVILPARERGVEHVWLVAVSMGSAPALRMAETQADEIAGLVILAPAFGSPFLAQRVRGAGGPAEYEPGPDDRDGRAFHWLAEPVRSDGSRVDVRLAYGRQDALAPVAETMATVLPLGHVLIGAGGHDWGVWNELFTALVETGFFQRSCGVTGSQPRGRSK